ncbi:MAG: hypothetical protein F4Y91_21060 [Gemmatimonadetes bacterium]|nr:hypothetical protein [Gemmatimonadota bacterium]MXY84474.1 hypothetical protein [Gemmatimonadota bacterium]MYB67566.1 hypothetical protein [Gemmatimonadota bacterium]
MVSRLGRACATTACAKSTSQPSVAATPANSSARSTPGSRKPEARASKRTAFSTTPTSSPEPIPRKTALDWSPSTNPSARTTPALPRLAAPPSLSAASSKKAIRAASPPVRSSPSSPVISAAKIIAALERHDITHVLGVPDNGSCVLYERLWDHDTIEVILTSREGEAYGLASGLYLGGAHPLVLIQNTGFLEAGDALRGTAYNMGIPLVMLVGYRGYATMAPGAPRVDTAATFFEPTLKAWNIPYTAMHTDDDSGQIDAAFAKAQETSLPTAVLLVAETA